MKVIADADAIIAQAQADDLHHEKALTILDFLIEQNIQVLYPSTAIAEAATHMQRALSSSLNAYTSVKLFTSPEAIIIEVNKQTLKNALTYFSPRASKKHTLFDCIVAAIAKEEDADAIFSFDTFYKKHGFKLTSDLLR